MYINRSTKYPCYGANAGMTAKQWWFETVKKTYQGTEALNQIEPQELEVLLPGIFDVLYNDIFGSKRGWVLKEDVVYTLTKLRDWRDQGAGPKFGVVSNFDDRLPRILAGVYRGHGCFQYHAQRSDFIIFHFLTSPHLL